MADNTHIRAAALAVRGFFSPSEWARLTGLYGFISGLHILGWGLYLHYAGAYPSLVGLGFVAYMFGLRHAFDADHIAAVDDTVRFMLQKGKRALGVGFFFSLGHATIVLGLAIAIAYAASAVKRDLPQLQNIGGLLGASVSGTFLWVIGILNLMVLLDVLKVWERAKSGQHSHAHLQELLAQRGLLNRLFGGRLSKLMNHSWQMYPLGLLFLLAWALSVGIWKFGHLEQRYAAPLGAHVHRQWRRALSRSPLLSPCVAHHCWGPVCCGSHSR